MLAKTSGIVRGERHPLVRIFVIPFAGQTVGIVDHGFKMPFPTVNGKRHQYVRPSPGPGARSPSSGRVPGGHEPIPGALPVGDRLVNFPFQHPRPGRSHGLSCHHADSLESRPLGAGPGHSSQTGPPGRSRRRRLFSGLCRGTRRTRKWTTFGMRAQVRYTSGSSKIAIRLMRHLAFRSCFPTVPNLGIICRRHRISDNIGTRIQAKE